MELSSGEKKEKENKGKKIVIISIAVMIALIIILVVAIMILQQAENDRVKLSVDGKTVNIAPDLMLTDSNTGERYFSISRVASLVGYSFYNGEYKKYSEDKTKCYVECENEIAMFELNSNTIYKNKSTDKQSFDAYKIAQAVTSYNGNLYATMEAIQTAFNTAVTYNNTNNTIYFQTLPYLVNYYKTLAESYGYTGISEDFITQKTLTKNMLVVRIDEKFGVVSSIDFSTLIGNKYDKIVYLENTEEFIVTNDGKTGILSKDGQTRIGLRYDEIGLIDGERKIYYAKNDNLYGVLNQNGRVLVYIQYNDIGIDRSLFPLVDMKNNLFLYDNCIPLKKDNKWGMADKNGNIILNFEYDELGYVENIPTTLSENESKTSNSIITTRNNDMSINNAILVPDIEGIVFGKNGKYGVVNSIGKIIIPFEFDKIYSITNEGKDEYFLESGNKTIKLTNYLAENRINVENNTNNEASRNTVTNTVINTTVNTINNVTSNTASNAIKNTTTNTATNRTTNPNNAIVIVE